MRLSDSDPPLRERIEDIPDLVNHFIDQFNRKNKMKIKSVSPAFLKALVKYNWIGNVRELESVIERAMFNGQSPQSES